MSPSIDHAVVRCRRSICALDSLLDQLRTVPLVAHDCKAGASIIFHHIKHILVLGITVLGLQNRLTTSIKDVSQELSSAIKGATSSIESAHSKVLRIVAKLRCISLDLKHGTLFLKEALKIGDHLDAFSLKVDILVDLGRLASLTRTAHLLKQVIAAKREILISYNIEDLREALMVFELSESLGRQIAQERIPVDTPTSPSSVNSADKRSSPVQSRAERAGFVSRMQSAKREQNWKAGNHTDPNASSSKSSAVLPTVDNKGSSNEPLPSPVSSIAQAPSVTSVSVEDVYDSYHDYDLDATLGLAGTDAVSALKRQPSHRSRSMKSSQQQRTKLTKLKSADHLSSPSLEPLSTRPRAFSNASQSTVVQVMSASRPLLVPSVVPDLDVRDQYY